MTNVQEVMLATERAAEELGLKPQTLVQWRHAGSGPPFYRFGRQVRYKLADLNEWREQRAVTPRDVA